jgi:hypothetical protein
MNASAAISDPLLRSSSLVVVKREARDGMSVSASSHAGYASRGTHARAISPRTVMNNASRTLLTGCGNTLWACRNFIFQHVWNNRRTSRRMLKKARLLTHPTLAVISPARPESAKTDSSPWDAPYSAQGRSERGRLRSRLRLSKAQTLFLSTLT